MSRKGINSFDEKNRRAVRRRNHIARDLREPIYRQRVIPSKKNKGEEFQKILDGYYEDE
jgi:stalled ribosome alternative rescue factor ArfA